MVMKLRNICLSRNGKPVLNNISGELKAGKIIALLGPNGAGKSTLVQVMARLLECQGEVQLQGCDIHNYSSEQLAQHLAYLPQHSQLQFPLEVEEVLSLATLPFSLNRLQQRQQVKNMIKEWGIESLADKDFRQLSGGEQQRCQIARTYLQLSNMKSPHVKISNTKLLSQDQKGGLWLLDEPASSLDLEHQQQLQKACLLAAKEGHCVVIVLHDLNQAFRLADEVWLMQDGHVVAQGATNNVMQEETISRVFKVKAQRIISDEESVFIFS
jgi:iron complex transport system ATP-binding protein